MSKHTFLSALAHKSQGGAFAVGTGTSIACQELMAAIGTNFPQAHTDPEKMAQLAIAGHSVLGMDVVMPLFSVCHEVGALGCNVNWGDDNSMPESGRPIWTSPADVRIPADFLHRPSCQTPLKAISLLKSRLGDSAAVCGKVFGSWTLAYHLFGVENFLMGTMDDPAATQEIIDRLVPATVAFANAQLQAGADCLLLADHATRDLCSPDAYRKFLQPLHSRLAAEIHAPLILHICGDTSDRVGMIAQTGLACFHWDTKSGSPQRMRGLAGEKMSLMGGINNTMLLNGRPEDITAAAVAAVDGGIDIIGPECAIPLRTPLANLKAIADVRKHRPQS